MRCSRSGVPAAAVTVLPGGVDNTAAEAAALRRAYPTGSLHRVIVVTSSYHLRRAGYAFRREFGRDGVQIIMRPSRYDEAVPGRWWTRRKTSATCCPSCRSSRLISRGLGSSSRPPPRQLPPSLKLRRTRRWTTFDDARLTRLANRSHERSERLAKVGGSAWESNPACPQRGQQPVLKTGRATGPRSLPLLSGLRPEPRLVARGAPYPRSAPRGARFARAR